MTHTINTTFHIGSYKVDAEAYFSGARLTFEIDVNGVNMERSSCYGSDFYKSTGLKGAALKAYDEKWLRDYATNSIMLTLMIMIEEARNV